VAHHQLPKVLADYDVAVQPSIEEGLSLVIGQLMASGIPVIATTNTGAEDVIRDGVDGWIVPIRSPDAIADVLSELAESPRRLTEAQREAATLRARGVSWDAYGERYAANLLHATSSLATSRRPHEASTAA